MGRQLGGLPWDGLLGLECSPVAIDGGAPREV